MLVIVDLIVVDKKSNYIIQALILAVYQGVTLWSSPWYMIFHTLILSDWSLSWHVDTSYENFHNLSIPKISAMLILGRLKIRAKLILGSTIEYELVA